MIKIKSCYKNSISTLICLCLLVSISGCASDQTVTGKTDYEQLLLQEINDSSQGISHSLRELNALANPYNVKIDLPFTEIKDSALQKRAKLSWYGDIEPLLRAGCLHDWLPVSSIWSKTSAPRIDTDRFTRISNNRKHKVYFAEYSDSSQVRSVYLYR